MQHDMEAWRRLPLTVRLGEFTEWTGWCNDTVRQAALDGKIAKVYPRKGGRARYRKIDISLITGLPM